MESIEASNARVVRALCVASRANSRTRTLQRTSLAFTVIRAFVGEFRAKYFLAVPLKTVEAKFCGVFRDAFVFKATLDHRFCDYGCLIINNPSNIVLEITAALSSIFDEHPFALT